MHLKFQSQLAAKPLFQDPQKAANAQLQSHLEQLKQGKTAASSSKSSKKDTDVSTSSGVTYELRMKPETSIMEENERFTRMDKRLEALEKALGVSNESMVRGSNHFYSIL